MRELTTLNILVSYCEILLWLYGTDCSLCWHIVCI